MLATLTNILIKLGLFSGVIVALAGLGLVINAILSPIYAILEVFFMVVRTMLEYFDFFLHTEALFDIIGYSLLIISAYWVFEGYLYIVKFFKHN